MEQQSSERRGFFKRAALAGALGALAAGIGFRAFAHGDWHGDGPMDPARMDEHIDRMLKHLYVEIDATEEQKRRLAPIVKDAARDLMPLRGKGREAKARALELLSAPSVDRPALEALRAEHLRLADDASQRLTRAIGDLAEVLTPEQRKTLAERIARHRHGWHAARS